MTERGKVLHVVVGHGLPNHFLNAVDSVRFVAPNDDVLVIDNGSRDQRLRALLSERSSGDARVTTILRGENEIGQNEKVGGLYEAYRMAFAHAIGGSYDYVHLLQGDMQVVWWDDEVVACAGQAFAENPTCVNLVTVALSTDKWLGDEFLTDGRGTIRLAKYGLTDTGLFNLHRWVDLDMRWRDHEKSHASEALRRGLQVILHPWPTDVQVPWPPVFRQGVQQGRDMEPREAFICRPLHRSETLSIKESERPFALEQLCVPWGWWCLAPMWITDLDTIDYWVYRWRAVQVYGWKRGLPRLSTRGLPPGWRRYLAPHRPSFRYFVTHSARAFGRHLVR